MKKYIVLIPSDFSNAKHVAYFVSNMIQFGSVDEATKYIKSKLENEDEVENCELLTFTLEDFISQVNDGFLDVLVGLFIAQITIVDSEFNEIEKAKDFLKDKGLYTDNLWSVEDVKAKFKCTDDEAYECLDKSLTNDATMEQIWLSIDIFGDMENLTPIEEEEEN